MRVLMDIWGGKNSQSFLARSIHEVGDMIELATLINMELAAGYLVNVREISRDGVPWGTESCFDKRGSA